MPLTQTNSRTETNSFKILCLVCVVKKAIKVKLLMNEISFHTQRDGQTCMDHLFMSFIIQYNHHSSYFSFIIICFYYRNSPTNEKHAIHSNRYESLIIAIVHVTCAIRSIIYSISHLKLRDRFVPVVENSCIVIAMIFVNNLQRIIEMGAVLYHSECVRCWTECSL